MVTVSHIIQFGLQGGDLKSVGQLLLLQCLLILAGGGDEGILEKKLKVHTYLN